MSAHSIRPAALALAMFIATVLTTFGAATASAQFNCESIKIINTTKCQLSGNIVSMFGELVVPFTAGPGQTITVPFGLPVQIVEVGDGCNTVWGLKKTECLTGLRAPDGCCFDFCLDTQSCTVTFKASDGPCPCK